MKRNSLSFNETSKKKSNQKYIQNIFPIQSKLLDNTWIDLHFGVYIYDICITVFISCGYRSDIYESGVYEWPIYPRR